MCFYFHLFLGCVESFIGFIHSLWNTDGFSIPVLWIKRICCLSDCTCWPWSITVSLWFLKDILLMCVWGRFHNPWDCFQVTRSSKTCFFQVSHWLLQYILCETSFFFNSICYLALLFQWKNPFFAPIVVVCFVPNFSLLYNYALTVYCGLWRKKKKSKTVLPFETMGWNYTDELSKLNISLLLKGRSQNKN